MSIVSLQFAGFVAISFLLYYICPKKVRWCLLLILSLTFFACSGPIYLLYIVYSALVAYLIGLRLGKLNRLQKEAAATASNREEKKAIKDRFIKRKKRMLALGAVLTLLELLIVKYTGFIMENASAVSMALDGAGFDAISIIAPLGCSYYTFTVVGYIADVYRGKAEAQRNPFKFLLFACYFPQIIQGPIPRYGELSPQLFEGNKFRFENLRDGALRILWGVFKKLTIAEVIGVFVGNVYGDYTAFSGTMLLIATILFSFQIYADFSGYVDIVAGVSQLFGIILGENFRQPYFSKTVPEFWRRWHISLSSWFREYVFYAMSSSKALLKLNKSTRAKFGNEAGRIISVIIPVLSVWLLTGLWHGASWNYIMWGLFHGVLIMFSIIFDPYNQKLSKALHIKTDCFSWDLFRMVRTFMLCTLSRIFFRAGTIEQAFGIFKRIFTNSAVPLEIYDCGINRNGFKALIAALIILLVVSLIKEHFGSAREWLQRQNVWFRWAIVWGLVVFILIFGTYGPNATTSFIYEQF